jgi:hypothetical protein
VQVEALDLNILDLGFWILDLGVRYFGFRYFGFWKHVNLHIGFYNYLGRVFFSPFG